MNNNNKTPKTFEEVVSRVDWDLLAKQKDALKKQADRMFDGEENSTVAAIDGVVHLIESLQDVAIVRGLWQWKSDLGVTPRPLAKQIVKRAGEW